MVLKHVDGEVELKITEEVVLKHVDGEMELNILPGVKLNTSLRRRD
jgi:hypothetical protein